MALYLTPPQPVDSSRVPANRRGSRASCGQVAQTMDPAEFKKHLDRCTDAGVRGVRGVRGARFSYWDGRNPTVDKWIISGISMYIPLFKEGFYLPRLPRSKISSIHSRLGLLGVLGGLYLPLCLNFLVETLLFWGDFLRKAFVCPPRT